LPKQKSRTIADAAFSFPVGVTWGFSNLLIEDFRKAWEYCKQRGID
jgi:hypothetical protein